MESQFLWDEWNLFRAKLGVYKEADLNFLDLLKIHLDFFHFDVPNFL